MSAEPDYLPADALAEEEPKYLRRQKPVEIRKRKFNRKSWPLYRRVLAGGLAAIVAGFAIYQAGNYFLFSPGVMLTSADQIVVEGNRFVPSDAVVEKFSADMGRSVVRVPLGERRKALETLPWVEQAFVQRVMPNRIRVEITERTPIAFLRNGTELALIDAHGVILDRPRGEDWQFPIVTGLPDNLPREERGKRMQTYQEFLKDIDLVRAGSSDRVSEIDLASAKDLRAVMTGVAGPNDPQAVTVQFGQGDFAAKYRMVVENFAQWQASNGRVRSIDLQYSRQVILNPDTSATTTAAKMK